MSKTVSETVGLQYLDPEDAVTACEKHFEYIKSILLKVKNLENRTLIEECRLIWHGMRGVPDNSLSPIKMVDIEWLPDFLAGEFIYTIREVDLWDVGRL